MKFFPLIWAGLRRRPARSVLTLLAVTAAFVLFGLLHGVVAGFDGLLDKMNDTRLRVQNRSSGIAAMPLSYRERIAAVPGVRRITYATIFPAYFREPRNGIPAAAVGPDFLAVFGELHIPADQVAAWQRTRTGAIVGAELAQRYGWKVGDKVPLESQMWPNSDGGLDWTFDVSAIANGGPDDDRLFAQELYFHWDYLDEARPARKGTVHQFMVLIDDAGNAAAVADAIDGQFENSASATVTQGERQLVAAQVQQIGDVEFFVNAVVAAVMFTLLFLTGSTMMQSVRDRLVELGVLKAVGFSDTGVFATVVAESLLLCLSAAVLGLGITALVFPALLRGLRVGPLSLPAVVWAEGLAIALLLGLLVAVWPAWRARRLSIADVLTGRK